MELTKTHHVTVLTHAFFRSHIEGVPPGAGARLAFAYHEVDYLTSIFKPEYLNSHLYYLQWQCGAYRLARRLHQAAPFDLIHHLTWGTFRFPSFLGLLGAPFVFGPVGGGESVPWRLTRSLPSRERAKEALRELIRISGRYDPLVWLCLWRSRLILCRTRETLSCLPFWARHRACVRHEIGAPAPGVTAGRSESRNGLALLYAGRLLGWKGIHLALRAVAQARERGVDVRLSIAGDGPMRANLLRLARQLGIDNTVKFHGQISRDALMSLYGQVDAFLFPSLHDSGGTVVLEALSRGLPVVCVDLGGPPNFVDRTCGYVVPARFQSEHEVVDGLTDAIVDLHASPERRDQLSRGALARARVMSWERQVDRAYADIEKMLDLA